MMSIQAGIAQETKPALHTVLARRTSGVISSVRCRGRPGLGATSPAYSVRSIIAWPHAGALFQPDVPSRCGSIRRQLSRAPRSETPAPVSFRLLRGARMGGDEAFTPVRGRLRRRSAAAGS